MSGKPLSETRGGGGFFVVLVEKPPKIKVLVFTLQEKGQHSEC